MVKTAKKNYLISDVLKSSLIAILIGAILVLVFATVLNFLPVEDKIVTAINQVIKVVAIFIGCFFGFKEKRLGIVKGLISGLIYSLGTFLIFGLINNSFDFGVGVWIDVALSAVIGAICGIITVNLRKNK